MERVTEKDLSIAPPIHFSIHDCMKFMRRDKFSRENLWCWCLTITYPEQTVVEPKIFFDWDGKFLFRKDGNTNTPNLFKEKEFLPFKTKVRAQKNR